MNKLELVSAVAEQANLTKKDAEAAIKALLGTIETSLKKGEKVQLIYACGSREDSQKERLPQTQNS